MITPQSPDDEIIRYVMDADNQTWPPWLFLIVTINRRDRKYVFIHCSLRIVATTCRRVVSDDLDMELLPDLVVGQARWERNME